MAVRLQGAPDVSLRRQLPFTLPNAAGAMIFASSAANADPLIHRGALQVASWRITLDGAAFF
jgi:hypothetical protein